MSKDYRLKKEISNKLSILQRRLIVAGNIKNKRKKLRELMNIRKEIKGLLDNYKPEEINNNFLFKDFIKKIKTLMFNLERENAKK